MNDCSRVRIYRVHCCCCCSPAAPGCPTRCQLTRLLLRLRLLCRLWAIALWTSQCWPPAAWDLWCLPRWRCMFAPKAPTGCFCYPAKRERERERAEDRELLTKSLHMQKTVQSSLYGFLFIFFFYLIFFSPLFLLFSHFQYIVPRAAASDKDKGNCRRRCLPLSCPCCCCCCCTLCSLNTSSSNLSNPTNPTNSTDSTCTPFRLILINSQYSRDHASFVSDLSGTLFPVIPPLVPLVES